MSLTNMAVFNEFLMPLIMERFPQEIAKFNAASNNTIVLTAANFVGSFQTASFYEALHASQRRVDRFAVNGAVAPTDISQGLHSKVKVAGGFGPIRYEPSQMTWLLKPTQEGISVAADQFVEALLADQLNTAIAALVAALSNVAAVTNDITAEVPPADIISQGTINDTLALFGDMSQRLRALIMTGTQYHRLIGQAIENSNNLFEIGGVAVREGTAFGQSRPIIITDAPALITGADQHVLALQTNAMTVEDGGDLITNIETNNGNERIETTYQSDYTFNLSMLGYTWDTVNGGESPSDVDLTTGANWDLSANDIKFSAGAIAIGS